MILNSTVKSNDFIGEVEQLKSVQLVVNTNNFNDEDLQDFINISEEIERSTRERRSQRRRSRSRSKTMVATMTREEIFESTNIDDDRFLNAMEHETTYEMAKDRVDMMKSIEDLMKYFGEDVNVKDDSFDKNCSYKKYAKGRVASAVASFCNKCSLAQSALSKSKTQQPEVKSNIQELRRIYETSADAEDILPSKPLKTKTHKFSRKNKVKQMALMFNNKINSMKRNFSPDRKNPEAVSSGIESISSPTFTSTLIRPKSPKLKKGSFPIFVTKLPSPKPSPLFKKKQMRKSPSINSLTESPATKRKQLQKQPSTTCLVAESVFSQLSVKDKALLYNKFIEDLANQNPKFRKHAKVLESNIQKETQKGEVVFERQNSVKHLRDSLEAKLFLNNTLPKAIQRGKRSISKLSIDVIPKSKDYEDSLQSDMSTSLMENKSQDILHVNTLTVVLKPSPERKKCLEKNKNHYKIKGIPVFENKNSHKSKVNGKRTLNMIRSPFCMEPFAPPKKMRRTRYERLTPGLFFQNQQLEKLFYNWLKANNGKAFDITPVQNKDGLIEIVPRNSRDNVLPPQQVEKILGVAISKLESDNDANQIKYNTEDERSAAKGVIEIELPLKIEIPRDNIKKSENENSDLASTTTGVTSEDSSQTDFKLPEVVNASTKPLRKKKLRRPLTLTREHSKKNQNRIFSTDSDSDSKANNIKIKSYSLPKSKKNLDDGNRFVFNTLQSLEHPCTFTSDIFELNSSLIRQVNSPSKIKTAYTLTVMSSPPYSESDFCDSDLSKTFVKESSRSWPSLFEASLDSDTNLKKDKFLCTEFIDLTNYKNEQENQKLLTESFIDQGFETGSNDIESPSRLPKKADNNMSKSSAIRENAKKVSLQQVFATCPISKCSPKTPAYSITTNTTTKEDVEINEHTASSLNESASLFSRQDTLNNRSNCPLAVMQKEDSSQFWITSGDFTAAITIHHCGSDRLMLLSNIYAQKCLKTKQMSFGIDDQKFCLNGTETTDEILKKVPQENNYSQYWFSTGDDLIPFRGKQLTSKKINSFFNYIREYIEESGTLRFGIDNYEFSNIYQQTKRSISPVSDISMKAISPLKVSDLDQSDLDSEKYEQSLHSISVASPRLKSPTFNSDDIMNPAPISPMNRNSSASLDEKTSESEFSTFEIFNTLQNQQSKLKFLEERLSLLPNARGLQESIGINESPEYMRKLRSIIKIIDEIGRSNGYSACTVEQLESCMFFLSHYADLCLAKCTAHIEKILDVVISQRSQ